MVGTSNQSVPEMAIDTQDKDGGTDYPIYYGK